MKNQYSSMIINAESGHSEKIDIHAFYVLIFFVSMTIWGTLRIIIPI